MKPVISSTIIIIVAFIVGSLGPSVLARYDPTWDSIDSRPLPAWYDESKVGIFIHWGLYSVPSYINEWFWYSWISDESQGHADYIKQNFKPGFSYEVFSNTFLNCTFGFYPFLNCS